MLSEKETAKLVNDLREQGYRHKPIRPGDRSLDAYGERRLVALHAVKKWFWEHEKWYSHEVLDDFVELFHFTPEEVAKAKEDMGDKKYLEIGVALANNWLNHAKSQDDGTTMEEECLFLVMQKYEQKHKQKPKLERTSEKLYRALRVLTAFMAGMFTANAIIIVLGGKIGNLTVILDVIVIVLTAAVMIAWLVVQRKLKKL